jgi:hypothetical protein
MVSPDPSSASGEPAQRPGFVFLPAPHYRKAYEWLFVLRSVGLDGVIRPTIDGQWGLQVVEEHASRAVENLRAYEAENRDWPPAQPRRAPLYEGSLWAGGILLSLVLFFQTTGPARLQSEWFTRGTASAFDILHGKPWQAVTALTLHADAQHILGNALVGTLFLSAVHRRLGLGLGTLAVLASGILGNVLNALWYGAGHRSMGSRPAGGSLTARANAALAHRRGGPMSRVGNGEGSRHPRAPAARGAGAGGPVPAPRPAPLAFPHPGPPLVHDACGRDEAYTGGSLPAPCPSPAGTGPAGLLGRRMRVLLEVVATGERTSWKTPGVRRGEARRGEARRGLAARRRGEPKRLRFQGWNGENSKEPRLVRGLGADELHLPRASARGLQGQPFTPRSPPEHRTSLQLPAPRVPSPQGMGKGRAEIRVYLLVPSGCVVHQRGAGVGECKGGGTGGRHWPPGARPSCRRCARVALALAVHAT